MNNDRPAHTSAAFVSEVAGRFGVLPNFFCSAAAAPGLIEELWTFAKSAYLDSPLPSLFKERLFVHLSRFCEIRYCIVRHVGFLMGEGHPAGDHGAVPHTLEQILALLRRTVPNAAVLEQAFARLRTSAHPGTLPLPETPAEDDLFDALTVMFLVPQRSAQARSAIRTAVGDRTFELLAAFLAFVRTAHYWTEIHPELGYEPDMLACMEQHPDLAALLLDDREAAEASPSMQLRKALGELDRAEVALRESETRQRALIEGIPQLVWRATYDGRRTWVSPQWCTYTGLSEQESLGFGWLDALHPDDRDKALALWQSIPSAKTLEVEGRICSGAERRYRWFTTRAAPVRDAAGHIVEWLGTSTDVDDLRRMQERQQVLVNELQHRARNLLGVVSAVAGKTLRQGSTVEAFEERLQALSRAQALLSQAGSDTVEVGAMVRAELSAYAQDGSEKVRVGGPEVQLTARQVQNFALALHELTTNAVKYGALKDGTGSLSVTWEVLVDRRDRRRLALSWVESGVAIQPEKVTRRGYGTELIQEALGYALEADVDYEMSADNVHCRVEMPIDQPR